MADFSMSDMPWLGQPADPAGSLLRGVQAGAAISGARTQRAALAQRKMEFDQERSMAERNWRERMAVLPLEMTLKQQEGELNKFKIEELLTARQDRIGNESTLLELNKNVARSFSEADGPETAQQMLFESLVKNPRLISDPRFKELRTMVDTSMAAKEQLIRLRNERAGVEGLGNVTVVTDPTDQRKATFVRTGPNSITAFPKVDDPNAPQSPTGKLLADRNVAFKAGLTNDVKQYDAVLAKQAALDGFSLTTNPDGTVNLTKGNPQGLTVATQSRLQEQSFNNFEAINTLRDAIAGIRSTPSAIGVRGKVGTAIEQAKGQLQPDQAMETPITDVRQKASVAFSRVAPALRIDSGNMSKYELNKLEQAGDVLGWEEAPQTAERKLSNLMAVVVGRELRVLKTQGKPVPDEILRQIQGEEIAGLIQSGLLTKEEANRLYQLSRQNGR